jgi:hypothetical protein
MISDRTISNRIRRFFIPVRWYRVHAQYDRHNLLHYSEDTLKRQSVEFKEGRIALLFLYNLE